MKNETILKLMHGDTYDATIFTKGGPTTFVRFWDSNSGRSIKRAFRSRRRAEAFAELIIRTDERGIIRIGSEPLLRLWPDGTITREDIPLDLCTNMTIEDAAKLLPTH